MAARRKRWLRCPRTTQERRHNQDKHDLLVRATRRNNRLPNAWDDYFPCNEKGWKKKRKTQYREDKTDFEWREFEFDFWDITSRDTMRNLTDQLDRLGYWYDWVRGTPRPVSGTLSVIRWYGPEM